MFESILRREVGEETGDAEHGSDGRTSVLLTGTVDAPREVTVGVACSLHVGRPRARYQKACGWRSTTSRRARVTIGNQRSIGLRCETCTSRRCRPGRVDPCSGVRPGRGRARTWLAAFTVPLWLGVLGLLPGYVHHERRVVARLGRRGAGGCAAIAARSAAALTVLVGMVLIAEVGPIPQAAIRALMAFIACSAVLGLIAITPRTMAESLAGRKLATDKNARKANRARVRRARWSVSSAASFEKAGGMVRVRDHILAVVPPGESVILKAATRKHALLYERLGCEPLASQPLRLIYQMST